MKATRTAAIIARRRPGAVAWSGAGFGVTVDSREARPWHIATEIPVTVRALAAGDYAATGLEERHAIERKSIDDFLRSITWEAERFRAELVKLRALDFAAIIVEATLEDVRLHRYRAQVTPDRVLSAAAGISVHYAPVHFAGTPQRAGDYAVRLLRSFHVRATRAAERRTA